MEIDTKVFCLHCKRDGKEASIVAIVESVRIDPSAPIVFGPASRDQYQLTITSFHCSFCKTVFIEPLGRPGVAVEILKKLQKKQVPKTKIDPALARLIKEVAASIKAKRQPGKKIKAPKK